MSGKFLFQTKPIVAALSLALCHIAIAAENVATPTLREVQVTDTRITALEAAQQVSSNQLAARRAATSDSANLFSDVPGVNVYSAGGVSSLPVIRGLADDRVRVKVDDMDLISACGNHMNSPLSYIDPSQVETAKVFAGITPVSVGGDSIAGSIVVNSRAPVFAKPGAGVQTQGELGAFYRSNGNVKGVNANASLAGENLSLRYSGATVESGDYHAAKAFKAAGLAAWGRNWLSGDTVGSSGYKSSNQSLGMAYRFEQHLVDLKLGWQDIPYQGYPNQRMDMTGNKSQQFNLRYQGQYAWGNLEARVYQEKTRHSMNYWQDKLYWYGATHTVAGMPMDTEGKNQGALVKATLPVSAQDLLRVGAEVQRYQLNDWWSPSGGGMAPNVFWNINNGQRDRNAVFGEWESRWNAQWTSLVGVRAEEVKTSAGAVQGYNGMMSNYASEAAAFNAKDKNRKDHNLDLTAVARYTPNEMQDYDFGYARKTRSPNLYERYTWSTGGMAMLMNNTAGDGNGYVGNLDLKPEVAHTLSAAAAWHDAAKETWGIKVAPFYSYVQNYIDAKRCSSANSTCNAANQTAQTGFVYLQYANQDAHLYGVDVSGYLPLAKQSAYGSFTLTGLLSYVRGKNETTGGNLYNIMPLNAKLAVVQRVAGWTNTVEGQFVAAKDNLSSVRNEVRTPGYALLNLRSSYEWKQVRLDIGIDNVFNRMYFQPLGGAYVGQGSTMMASGTPWGVVVPGMGRSFYAGVNIKF